MPKTALNKIDSWNDFQRPIAKALREKILGVDRTIDETVKWGYPCFVRDGKNICSIVPHRRHVNLQFFDGVELNDPDDKLQGRGKRMRHIKYPDADTVEEEQKIIFDFVEKAIAYMGDQ